MADAPDDVPEDTPTTAHVVDTLVQAAPAAVTLRGDAVAPEPVFAALRRACRGLLAGEGAPWRFVHVASVRAQAAVVWNFEVCNADVLARRRDHPREHDLAALHAAPVQIAAFADPAQAPAGAPDGRTAGEFAVARTAAAIARFRVCAAAETLAVRWLWALDPAGLAHALEVSAQWRFVGYLCVGRPSPGRTEAARAAGSADPLAGRHLRR